MKEIIVRREGNKIIGQCGEHVAFTIISPPIKSIDEIVKEMARDSDRDYASMVVGTIISGVIYDDESLLEHADWMMRDQERSLKRRAENHMIQCLDLDYATFSDCGEVNCTKLAENAASYLDHDEWLDDETHWIWDVAVDMAEEYGP
jgi:hypothetical protein